MPRLQVEVKSSELVSQIKPVLYCVTLVISSHRAEDMAQLVDLPPQHLCTYKSWVQSRHGDTHLQPQLLEVEAGGSDIQGHSQL